MHDVGYTFDAHVLWERNIVTSDVEIVKVISLLEVRGCFAMLKET